MENGYKSNEHKSNIMFELITTPFIIICALIAIAFFVGMKVGEDNQKNKVDKLQDWKPHE